MDLRELRSALEQELLAFCWGEWAQLGVLAAPLGSASPWAQDPEALIVLTLEVARMDPRLFDETLDWMTLNERLLSVRRMRAMCIDDEDRALVRSANTWLSWQRPSEPVPTTAIKHRRSLQPLFYMGGPIDDLDPSFAAAGFARPPLRRSGKSSHPNLSAPIALALRLRAILGVGIRAEVVRVMLGKSGSWVNAQELARASAFSKRNVHDALAGLVEANVIAVAAAGSELRYMIDTNAWSALLGLGSRELPGYREWRPLLGALRRVMRFARHDSLQESSAYMSASATRQLLDELRPELSLAGIGPPMKVTAEDAPRALCDAVTTMLSCVSPTTGAARTLPTSVRPRQ